MAKRKPDPCFQDNVPVKAQDLWRLLIHARSLMVKADTHWTHGYDWDQSFEALADVIDAYLDALGKPPDPRTRCPEAEQPRWQGLIS